MALPAEPDHFHALEDHFSRSNIKSCLHFAKTCHTIGPVSAAGVATQASSESASVQARTESSPAATSESIPSDSRLTWSLFAIVAASLVAVLILLSTSLYFQWSNYSRGIDACLRQTSPDHGVILTYSRAWDFAVSKTLSIFLGFLLILIGALYILRKADTSYALGVEGASIKGSFTASSPGLIMVTLGVALVAFANYNKSFVGLDSSGIQQRQVLPNSLIQQSKEPVVTPNSAASALQTSKQAAGEPTKKSTDQ